MEIAPNLASILFI